MRKKVGYSTTEANEWEARLKDTVNAFNKALGIATKYIVVNDLVKFYESPIEFFNGAYIDKYMNEYPPFTPLQKMYDLSSIEVDELQEWVDKYKSGIKINPETLEAIEKPDFNIYVEGEEVPMFDRLQKVCIALNELKESVDYLPMGVFVQGTGGMLIYDWNTHLIEPNLGYIKMANRPAR